MPHSCKIHLHYMQDQGLPPQVHHNLRSLELFEPKCPSLLDQMAQQRNRCRRGCFNDRIPDHVCIQGTPSAIYFETATYSALTGVRIQPTCQHQPEPLSPRPLKYRGPFVALSPANLTSQSQTKIGKKLGLGCNEGVFYTNAASFL